MPLAGRAVLDRTGRYIYTWDLMKIDRMRPAVAPDLQGHPDREFVRFTVDGIHGGFWISYNHSAQPRRSCGHNMVYASQHPEPIQKYVASETAAGRFIGPVSTNVAHTLDIQISRFGIIPKPHQPGKWRLITDLSSPTGTSVNDGRDPNLCSVAYASVHEAVNVITRLGRGTQLAKFDLESAYRLVRVHPTDCGRPGVK